MTMRGDDPGGRKDDDADLRAAFAALRRDDSASAPGFEPLLAAAEARSKAAADRSRRLLVPVMAGTLAAAALVALVITAVRRPAAPLPSLASIEQWTAPTDFLLETPGREFLETVPRIGVMRSESP